MVSSSENIFALEDSMIGEFLSSPKFSFISFNSFLIKVFSLAFELRIFSSSFFSFLRASLSSSSLICSSFASCLSFISNIALACISDILNFLVSSFLGSSDCLMILITLSRSR